MIEDIKNSKDLFGEDFPELFEGFAEEVRQNIEETLAALENCAGWSEETLNIVLAKLHGLKGVTGQLSFSFVSKKAHEVEDLFAVFRNKNELPPKGYIQALTDFLEAVQEYLEEVEQNLDNPNPETFKDLGDLIVAKARLEESKTAPVRDQATDNVVNLADLKTYQLDQRSYQSIFGKMTETLTGAKQNGTNRNLASKLEESVYLLSQARLVQLKPVAKRVDKLVASLKKTLNKDFVFKLSGVNEKVDRVIYSSLGEILVHLIKNAVDHGLEPSEERKSAGKDPVGKLALTFVSNEDGFQVLVQDDGRGLDPEAISQKAMEKGIVTREEAELMTSYEKQFLVFAPGFSTKSEANDISGRGVGMDAVVKEVKKHGGKLTLSSEKGKGCAFSLQWPASFKMVPSVTFKTGEKVFALPARALAGVYLQHEKFSVEEGGVELVHNGDLLPLIDLGLSKREANSPVLLALDAGGFTVGLLADEVLGIDNIFFQAVAPSEKLSPLVTGIAKLDPDSSILGLNINEIRNNLNHYMSDGETTAPSQTRKEAPMKVLQFESLGGSVKKEDLYAFIDDEGYIEKVKTILEPVQNQPEIYKELINYVAGHFDSFRETIADVDVADELEYMVAVKYAYLKADWIMYNVQIQYKSIAGTELADVLVYKAALCSSMIERFEQITNHEAVNKITNVLASPSEDAA